MQITPRRASGTAFRLAAFSITASILAAMAAAPAHAQTAFTALLSGTQETPQNAATGSGSGFVFLSADQTLITVDLSWTGLTGGVTAGDIHGPGTFGVSAPVLLPLVGIPATAAASISEQISVSPAQVSELEDGLLYFNLHTAQFPGGEIRGQILPAAVPEASTTVSLGLLLGLGLSGALVAARKKKPVPELKSF